MSKELIIVANNPNLPDCEKCGKPIRIVPVRNLGEIPIYSFNNGTPIRIVPWALTQIVKCGCESEKEKEEQESEEN